MPTAFKPDFRIVLFSSPLMEQSAHELMDAGFPPTQGVLCAFGDYMEAQQARLPDIPDIEQISPRVIRVLGQNPGKFALQGTNTYIVGTGPQRLIVDTGQGEPKWAALIASTLSSLNITISCVLLTHWHLDHSGGVSDLIRLYPELSASIYKNSPGRGQQSISDGQVFAVEGAKLRAVHTPGHSDDHMCFILEEDNAIFTGDHVVSHCSAAFEELSAWMESLRTLQSYNCQFGYPAHGEVIQELPKKLEYELASKERRELRVLRALAGIKKSVMPGNNGGVTVRQLVDSMYGTDLESRVKEVAIEPAILQLLRKLTADGKVAFEIRGGIRKWFAI